MFGVSKELARCVCRTTGAAIDLRASSSPVPSTFDGHPLTQNRFRPSAALSPASMPAALMSYDMTSSERARAVPSACDLFARTPRAWPAVPPPALAALAHCPESLQLQLHGVTATEGMAMHHIRKYLEFDRQGHTADPLEPNKALSQFERWSRGTALQTSNCNGCPAPRRCLSTLASTLGLSTPAAQHTAALG